MIARFSFPSSVGQVNPGRWITSAPVRWLLAVLFLLLSWQAFQLAAIDLARQSLRVDMQALQSGGDVTREELSARANALVDRPFDGAQADVRADALALAAYASRDAQGDMPAHTDAARTIRDYRLALTVRPADGSLWARYGYFLSSLHDADQEVAIRDAFDQALELSPRDYNTMRLLADLGIRLWPVLGCASREALVSLLDHAAKIDDHILSRWNTVFGQRPMARYLDELYSHHQFSIRWARIQAAQCASGG